MAGHQSNTIQLCSKLTRDGGKVLLFGLPPDKSESQMSIGYEDMARNLTLIKWPMDMRMVLSRYSYSMEMEEH
eukprot:scaffold17842_cov160-Skeletonema_dohrnii-CCMP3373.AAC.1